MLPEVGLLSLDAQLEPVAESTAVDKDEAFALVDLHVFVDAKVPVEEGLEELTNWLNRYVQRCKVFKFERLHESEHLMAFLEVSRLLLEILDILRKPVRHGLLGRHVGKAALGNRLEPWSTLSDQTTNILLQLLLGVDRLYILARLLHVSQKLLESGNKVLLVSIELQRCVVDVVTEGGVCLDEILLGWVVHLRNDEVGSLLVNADLGLYHTVVDESDEGAKTFEVHAGKRDHLVSDSLVLLFDHKRLFLLGFAFFGIVHLVLVLQRS